MSSAKSLTIEAVKHHFTVWRANKKNPREKIPESLWSLVQQD